MKRTKFLLTLISIVVGSNACISPSPTESQPVEPSQVYSGPSGPFFGLTPTEEPQLLLPNWLETPLDAYNGTFPPSGDEFFFTIDNPDRSFIMHTMKQEDGSWTTPKAASFTGEHADYDPLFSPDGTKLYFSSLRPVKPGARDDKSGVWEIERKGEGWSEPKWISLSGMGDYYSSLTNSGVMYFNVWFKGDLYKAIPNDTGFTVEVLDESINGGPSAGDPFVSPDEDYLIFRSYGEESLGQGDLFISFNRDGKWSSPIHLDAPINSSAHEMCPWVSTDGKWFIFASARLQSGYNDLAAYDLDNLNKKFRSSDNGKLNLYYMDAGFIQDLKEKYLSELTDEG